ncbi:MAG: asparagine synthase (glutamine-hydrolyzing) [Bacillota bacterium]
MCGITGWIDWERNLTQEGPVLAAMTETLSYRGPDASGIWLSSRAALGHRRLIVVDPAGGGQPMVRQRGDETYVITYNGELYNTPDLRQELIARGYRFQGHSDTEVLLVSYMEWGAECVERLNGIFAFGIWREKEQSLFLARDRLGVKPLFYTQKDACLLFGSEIKALLAHPKVQPEVDAEGLAELFALGPARTPGHGVFRGIKEIRPGYCLFYNRNGLRLRRYWTLQSQSHPDDLETTAHKIRDLFQDTVEGQLVADVPVCTLLSGGLDSSIITALAAKALKGAGMGPLRTYSIDYVDNDRHFRPNDFETNADAPWIRLVSEYLGTEHKTVTVDTPQLVDALITSLRARDLPGMADVDSSLYLFCCEVKKEATVALSGESADEVFGGYPWFFREEALASDTFPWAPRLKERLRFLSPELTSRINPVEYVAERIRETLAEAPRLPGEDRAAARTRELFYLNINWFLTTLLDRKDRMSMATGLEVRVPYCDHRLVEYVWNIPWEMKTYDGQAKGILRQAMKGLLPDKVLTRRKSPYPKTHNPAYLQAVRELLLEVLQDSHSPLHSLIDRAYVREVAQSNQEFDIPWFGQLMRLPQIFAYLVMVDAWFREYRVAVRL